jgi:hypothetical protein
MASFSKFQPFVEALCEGKHDFSADTLKVMLTNTAPSSSDATKGDITEISSGNGYSAGGTVASTTSSSQTAGVYKLILGDVTFTASGGAVGPFRYAVLYNDSEASDGLVGFYDYGASVTLADGESFTVDFDPTDGVLTLT